MDESALAKLAQDVEKESGIEESKEEEEGEGEGLKEADLEKLEGQSVAPTNKED